jgi:diguanylate cyclase (GGDEF)-like protein
MKTETLPDLEPFPTRVALPACDPARALARSGLVAFAVVERGTILDASEALRDLLGRTTPAGQLDGEDLLANVAPADRTGVARFCAFLQRRGERAEHRCRMMLGGGVEIPVLLAGRSIAGADRGRIVLVVQDLRPWIDVAVPAAGGDLPEAFDLATGFPTRALLHDRMQIALAAARRHRRRAAVLRVQLLGLEDALASLGAGAAEQLQVAVSEALRNCARDSDTFARTGAQEFVLLLPEISQRDDAGISAARIVETVSGLCARGVLPRGISAHIGVALFPTDATSPAQLLQVAGEALAPALDMAGGGFALADATRTELGSLRPIEYLESYRTGIELVDSEHVALVDRTNGLVRHLHDGSEPMLLKNEIAGVIDLLAAHVQTEAQLLDPSPYAGSTDERLRNLRFLDELRCIVLHANAQSITLAVRHLYDWLLAHLAAGMPGKALPANG